MKTKVRNSDILHNSPPLEIYELLIEFSERIGQFVVWFNEIKVGRIIQEGGKWLWRSNYLLPDYIYTLLHKKTKQLNKRDYEKDTSL